MLRLATLFLALACFARPSPAAIPPEPPAVAVGVALSVEDGRTRLTVKLSRAVQARGFVLERPDRAIIDLGDVNVQVRPASERLGVVSGLRAGVIAPGRARIVLDLAEPARIARIETVGEPEAGLHRLVVELVKIDRPSFRQTVALGRDDRDPLTTGSLGDGPGGDSRPLVALDPGHGGTDSGAVATTGALEKDIVLAFALTLRDRLLASGRFRVMMTRDGDSFVPLDERVRLARNAGADLFVSIHGDSIGSAAIRGATIYTGAEQATDLESARLAERENAADLAGGVAPPEVQAGIADILHQLTLRETRGLSHRFANLLHGELRPVLGFSAHPHREAGFRVLRAPDMTSVLVELGYLSNAKDANLLLSDDWRRHTAAAMAGAVERFFGARLRGAAAAILP
ncbi:N-acetylmuramoyl-L-alanine amidase [Enterovirga sp.]|uniref:N-acetylmuramoyl-L-alanine amidase n=1 Tax=Enterovirga sp. TaxID=2026350 RepID=UPI00260C5090|nr:N-acetylmuramoyl-L-alanine amidase [Enterovirga sp.]